MTTRKQRLTVLASSLLLTAATANAGDQQPSEASLAVSVSSISHTRHFPTQHDTTALSAPDSVTGIFKKQAQAPAIKMNPAAVTYVAHYLKKNNEALVKVEQRSEGVFRIMEPILRKYNIPVALKYLAVVESDLKRTAVSRVGAAGPWQLMPVTARELGLKVTGKRDDRKQYYASTVAAARYLRDLYTMYEDWLLVIAAYNAGPGTINKAIRRAGSRNFWKLQYFLPAETRGHVKRFIGTHYYFEGSGSETTLTKAENLAHTKALARFAALQQNAVAAVPATAIAVETPDKTVVPEPALDPCLVSKDK